MSAEKIKAGEAYVRVSCDDTELKRGLQEVSERIDDAAREISAKEKSLTPTISVDASSVRSAVEEAITATKNATTSGSAFFNHFVVTAGDAARAVSSALRFIAGAVGELGDQFEKAAKRTGVSSATLSEYAHAAKMSGADFSAVESGFKRMAKTIESASQGSAEAAAALSLAGVAVSDLKNLAPDEQFEKLAQGIASISDPSARAAAAMKLFGANGTSLLPLFEEGEDGLRALREEARRLGVSIDDDAAKMGAEYSDSIDRAKTAARGLSLALGAMVAPAATDAFNAIAEVIAKIGEFVRNNRALVSTVATVAAGLAAATTANLAFGIATSKVATAVRAVSAAMKVASAAALANPYTALAAAVLAAAAAFYSLRKARQAANDVPTSTKAAEQYEAGNASRESDREDVNTLETLRKKQELQKLSNEEILQAVSIVAKLKSKYGDVGYEVDAVTGKITAASDAQRKLNQQMAAARKKELEAAVAEKKHNLEGNRLERSMADEEVSDWEMNTRMRRRNESWWSSVKEGVKDFDGDEKAKKLYILELDEEFQQKTKDARAKEEAELARLQAELAAINSMETAQETVQAQNPQPEPVAPTTNLTADEVDSAFDMTAGFIEKGAEDLRSEVEKQCDAIDKERDRLIESLTKLVDPEGQINWNDAAQVDELLKNSPAAAELYDRAREIRESAEAQKRDVVDKAKRENLDKLERDAKAAAPVNEERDAYEKRLAKINETFDSYISALNQEIMAAPDDVELQQRRDAAVERKKEAVAAVEKERDDEQAKAASEQKAKDERLSSQISETIMKYGSPIEKVAIAEEGVRSAIVELRNAQDSGDTEQIAAALGKLGEAQDKYSGVIEAQKSVERGIKSVGGSFDAWQAASLTNRISTDKKMYDESRKQTRYLAEIARNIGAAVFG